MTTKITKTMLLTTVALLSITVSQVYAAESFPTWATNQASPNGWSCSNECYAKTSTSGVNDVYAKSNAAFETRDAIVHNNAQWNPVVTTSALQITTSNSLIGMQIDTVYDGQMTTGFGSIAEFSTGIDLYQNISGTYYKVSGCYDTLTAAGDLTDFQTLSCNASNSGSNTYRAGATHQAHAYNYFGGVDTIVDFYDSGAGDNNKAETDRLEICAGAC